MTFKQERIPNKNIVSQSYDSDENEYSANDHNYHGKKELQYIYIQKSTIDQNLIKKTSVHDDDYSEKDDDNNYREYDHIENQNFKEKQLDADYDEYSENDENSREYKNISQFYTLKEYFDFFEEKYGFDYNNIRNSRELFEQLARFMKWSRKYYYELRKLESFNEDEEKTDFLLNLCEENDFTYDYEADIYVNFENLSDYMGWRTYEKRKKDFDFLVGSLSEKQFETAELMQNLIRSYGLLRKNMKMPKTIDECKDFLEKYLFVNIYDFASGNLQKFGNLQDLRDYTSENHKYFPLEDAKDNFAYKILLRHLKSFKH